MVIKPFTHCFAVAFAILFMNTEHGVGGNTVSLGIISKELERAKH